MNTQSTQTLLASALLTILAASAGHAQSTQLFAPPAGEIATTTAPYPVGVQTSNNDYVINGPFTVAAGNTNVTYTATTPGAYSFLSFTNFDGSVDFPKNTQVIDTSDGNNSTGPLQINFISGVSSFGLNVQDYAFDTETFTFTTLNGTSPLTSSTFVTGPIDNTSSVGKSVFLGAQAVSGQLITSVLISSSSVAVGPSGAISTVGSNDFYFGPLSTFAPVPEASTTMSFGLLLMLGIGVVLSARKKTAAKASLL